MHDLYAMFVFEFYGLCVNRFAIMWLARSKIPNLDNGQCALPFGPLTPSVIHASVPCAGARCSASPVAPVIKVVAKFVRRHGLGWVKLHHLLISKQEGSMCKVKSIAVSLLHGSHPRSAGIHQVFGSPCRRPRSSWRSRSCLWTISISSLSSSGAWLGRLGAQFVSTSQQFVLGTGDIRRNPMAQGLSPS